MTRKREGANDCCVLGGFFAEAQSTPPQLSVLGRDRLWHELDGFVFVGWEVSFNTILPLKTCFLLELLWGQLSGLLSLWLLCDLDCSQCFEFLLVLARERIVPALLLVVVLHRKLLERLPCSVSDLRASVHLLDHSVEFLFS